MSLAGKSCQKHRAMPRWDAVKLGGFLSGQSWAEVVKPCPRWDAVELGGFLSGMSLAEVRKPLPQVRHCGTEMDLQYHVLG